MPTKKKVEPQEEVQEEIPVKKKKVEAKPKNAVESVVVCKDENGENGKRINGVVSPDGKSVTTLEGVTYAL